MKTFGTFTFGLFFFAFIISAYGAVGDHVFSIELFYGHYQRADTLGTGYEFGFEISTDAQVKLVEFLTPTGTPFTIPQNNGQWDEVNHIWTEWWYNSDEDIYEWEFDQEFDDPSGFAAYGDGWFTVTVTYQDDSTEQTFVWYGMDDGVSAIPMPTQLPVIESPEHRSSLDSPVTVSWQACTDPDAIGIHADLSHQESDNWTEQFFDLGDTQWQDVALDNGTWEVSIAFYNGVPFFVNADGIECLVVKYTSAWGHYFAVGQPWLSYEVWGGYTDYRGYPEWWLYYYNIHAQGYTRLGESDGRSMTFSGTYPFYVIACRDDQVYVDALQTVDGWYMGSLTGGNVDQIGNLTGSPDQQYVTMLKVDQDEMFDSFIVIENTGDWNWIKVITDVECPPADLDGDCHVTLSDLAIFSQYWLQ